MPEQVTLSCVSCDTSFEPGPNGGFCPNCDTPHPDYTGGGADEAEDGDEEAEATGVEFDEAEDVDDADESQVDDSGGDGADDEDGPDGSDEKEAVDETEPDAVDEGGETDETDEGADEVEAEADEGADADGGIDTEDEPADDGDTTESCHSCGAAVDPDMAFCPDCGAKLEEDDEPTLDACPSCDYEIDDETYCPSCGLHLDPIRDGEVFPPADDATDVPETVTIAVNGEEYTFEDGDTFGRQEGEWLEDLVEASGGRDEVTYVSSDHLEFTVEDDGIYVVDVSTNGTKHNGTVIDGESARLEDGDTLELADRAKIEVRL
ncbi:double zinc ribbon domain-containing protein [Natronobacterium gregoryi]|uniref:DNA-binding protein n=2 Tax=Natronobacterium gregoryi TaxID=44930 RepID=L0AIK4_NATGS|nr:zinc ribbon domain-containing protein [Natronobacterium gregoryi]AFZ73274.1 primosomal protein N' (replication factor Y) - superfamily II helicase [Natronobacterium gregoryi SP2]ELY71266.1 DNA-binding protein [Natronobacterium gregoryi SP2]PLK18774.1 zinc-ribbon domain-containing protein [Natronobacterium gregoryi SP2]SFJ64630.1 replication restart DNA helicase PriA [Natronobacterium gregoryi]